MERVAKSKRSGKKASTALVLVQPNARTLTFAGVTVYERSFRPFTVSPEIARRFDKNHKDVLRAIRNMECSAEFSRRNFALSTYKDERGKEQPMYEVTRDGFSFLAMGFTGKEAARWKEDFISAFNALERTVLRAAAEKERRASLDWQQQRAQAKLVRREQTDCIKEFMLYATAQGSRNSKHYFANLSTMENRALGFLELGLGESPSLRDRLNLVQLGQVQTADNIVVWALREGMEQGLPYKDIYQLAKRRVEAFAAALPPPAITADSKATQQLLFA